MGRRSRADQVPRQPARPGKVAVPSSGRCGREGNEAGPSTAVSIRLQKEGPWSCLSLPRQQLETAPSDERCPVASAARLELFDVPVPARSAAVWRDGARLGAGRSDKLAGGRARRDFSQPLSRCSARRKSGLVVRACRRRLRDRSGQPSRHRPGLCRRRERQRRPVDLRSGARAAAALDAIGVDRPAPSSALPMAAWSASRSPKSSRSASDASSSISARREPRIPRPPPRASSSGASLRSASKLAGARRRSSIARGMAMLTYRTPQEFAAAVRRRHRRIFSRSACSEPGGYLRARGEAFLSVMTPRRFLSLSASIDRHRVDPAAHRVPALLIGADSDQLVPAGATASARAPRLAGPAELHLLALAVRARHVPQGSRAHRAARRAVPGRRRWPSRSASRRRSSPRPVRSAIRPTAASRRRSGRRTRSAGPMPDDQARLRLFAHGQSQSRHARRTLAELEGAAGGVVTNSGQSAALLALAAAPRRRARRRAPRLLWRHLSAARRALSDQGKFRCAFVDQTDDAAFAAATRGRSGAAVDRDSEQPAAPDHRHRASAPPRAKDGRRPGRSPTTPCLRRCRQRPLDLGCDLVLHSTTKALNGHARPVRRRAARDGRRRWSRSWNGGRMPPGSTARRIRRFADLARPAHAAAARRPAGSERNAQSPPGSAVGRRSGGPLSRPRNRRAAMSLLQRSNPDLASCSSFQRLAARPRRTALPCGALDLITLASSLGGFRHPDLQARDHDPPRHAARSTGRGRHRARPAAALGGLEDCDDLIADLERGFAAR